MATGPVADGANAVTSAGLATPRSPEAAQLMVPSPPTLVTWVCVEGPHAPLAGDSGLPVGITHPSDPGPTNGFRGAAGVAGVAAGTPPTPLAGGVGVVVDPVAVVMGLDATGAGGRAVPTAGTVADEETWEGMGMVSRSRNKPDVEVVETAGVVVTESVADAGALSARSATILAT